MAGYGVAAFFETKLLPVTFVVFLVALFIVVAQRADAARRPAPWAAAGAILGVMTIGHAASVLLLAATLLWIALDRSRPRAQRALRAGACLAAAAVVIAPVTLRNRAASGGFTLVTDNAGITFWQGNNPRSVGVYVTPEGFTGAIATQREESARLAEAEAGRPLTDAEVSRHWLSKGARYLGSDPAHAAGLIGRKALLAVASTEQPLEYSPRVDPNPVRRLLPIPFAAIFALAVVGLPSALRSRAGQPALMAAAATFVTLLVFYVASRYRLPAVPALAILAGSGGAILRDRLAQPGHDPGPILSAIVAIVVSSFWFPLTQTRLAKTQDAMTLSDLGTAHRETGRIDEAVTIYRASLRLNPLAPFVHLDLGKALAHAGRRGEALREAEEAVRLGPGIGEAYFDLGVLRYTSGDFTSAADAFREAFRLEPGNAHAGNNLAGTCLKLGRVEEARATVIAMRDRGLPVDPPLARVLGL
jgi:tetratricopeptide (TPR) repeat protein